MSEERDPRKNPIDLEDLLREVQKPKALNELLNEMIDEEMRQEYELKQVQKQRIIDQLISASRIYEKMPLERLAIKLKVDINEILDLLEEIILNHEFTGVTISGKELIFNKIPKPADLDQKPFHVMKPAVTGNSSHITPRVKPLKKKMIDVKFKVLSPPPENKDQSGETQEIDSLKVETSFKLVMAQVQVKLNLINHTSSKIDDISVKFLTSPHLYLLRMKPAYKIEGDFQNELHVRSIPSKSHRRILFYFSLWDCQPVEINLLLEYTDHQGNFRSETVRELIQFDEPSFSRSEEIDEVRFQEMIQDELEFKGIRSLGMPGVDAVELYLIMKEILVTNTFELVGEKLVEDEDRFIGWYYTNHEGIDGGNPEPFIIIAQIINKKVEFFAMSNDKMSLCCGLTFISRKFVDELVARGIIGNMASIMELYCMSCGGILSRFPANGEVYECKFCGAKMQF